MTTTPEISAGRISRIRARLLEWYDKNRRDLPWRHTSDPFAIWISETMLQQTRVETVIPYYERFLERFPDLETLADADLEDVYGLWTGLGYYSRARNLHSAARSVARENRGRLPDNAEELRDLAGIGRYTAGAVASIAFDREEPVVDGNVIRVLTRLLDWHADVKNRHVVEGLWTLAGRLVLGPRPGDLNQAIMELGATVCTPRAPDCTLCPLRRSCGVRRTGHPESLPIKKKRTGPTPVRGVAAWIERRGKALAVRRPEGGLLGGMWELPGGQLEQGEPAEEGLRKHLEATLGLRVGIVEKVGQIEHLFSHRRLRLEVFRAHEATGRVRRNGPVAHRWLEPEAIAGLPQGGPTRKALTLLGHGPAESPRARNRKRAPRSEKST